MCCFKGDIKEKMKGVILAGGLGTRLLPLTRTTNKHLLPVFDKQMIMYPLQTLKDSGIKDILIISGPGHAGQFLELLGSGYELGLDIKYSIQEKPLGIAHALWIATRDYAKEESVVVILGDNIFEDNIKKDISEFKGGAKIFLKQVNNPSEFGIAEFNDWFGISGIEEKPKHPKSDYIVTGIYFYDASVFEIVRTLEPSGRGELEITDVNNAYIEKGELAYDIMDGWWTDAGTFESLNRANELVVKEPPQ